MITPIFEFIDNIINIGNRKYTINLSFDRVLKWFDFLDKNEGLNAEEVADIGYSIFVITPQKANIYEKSAVMLEVTKKIKIEGRKLNKKTDDTAIIDFKVDSGYIYAAFMQAYGVDLYEQQGKLHWHKFIALLQSLPDNTRMREIMSIRARPIPLLNKHNYTEIQRLTELKSLYAIKQTDNKEDSWDRLFSLLEKQVK